MKFLITGDFHLKLNNPQHRKDGFYLSQLEKVKFILELAKKEKCKGILQPGDFFDTPRPSYFLVQLYINLFKQYNIPIYTIFGQHDLYLHSEDSKNKTALKVMEASGVITLLDSKTTGIIQIKTQDNLQLINLYGCSFNEEPLKTLNNSESFNILLIHKMILEKKLWDKQENFIYVTDFAKK